MAATSGGALWRDEANSVGLATLPHFRNVWNNLPFDSFPLLWLLVIREFSALAGPMNDPAFRVLGFTIGVGVVAALWLNARSFRHSLPLVSLALLGMSPSMIRWGDTVRAYGFGILLILVTCALLWRFLQRPDATRLVATAVAAVASVHTLFYNAVVLLAFSAGAVAVCLRRRDRKRAAEIVMVGVVAGISLAAYLPTIRGKSRWDAVVTMPDFDLAWFWTKLEATLNTGGPWTLFLWCLVVVLSVVGGLEAMLFARRLKIAESQREVVLFCLVSLLVGVAGNYIFLKALSYYTEPWYYLSLMALTAVCVDALLGALIQTRGARITRLAAALVILVATLVPTRRAVRTRLTDVDVVAAQLGALARPGDLVLVTPWHYGISFNRYYRGPAEWMTVPPISSHLLHRYDLLTEQMHMPDQTFPARQATDRAANALLTGHRVFIAGGLVDPPPGEQPKVLPPAPWPGGIWSEGAHEQQWSMMVSQFLTQHVAKKTRIPIEVTRVVSRYENLSLEMMEGWLP